MSKRNSKEMTSAVKAAQEFRDAANKGRIKIMAKDYSSVVYLYTNFLDQVCAIGYRGRARKPAFINRYKSSESRMNTIKEWMQAQAVTNNRRKPDVRTLEVDDVLMAMWGYEQTNVDYYKVTKLIGKTMVEIVEIGALSKVTGSMQGESIPDPQTETGEPMRRRANGQSVVVDRSRYASKLEPKMVAGCKVYSPTHWTAYY